MSGIKNFLTGAALAVMAAALMVLASLTASATSG
jgi:hypothetical protein